MVQMTMTMRKQNITITNKCHPTTKKAKPCPLQKASNPFHTAVQCPSRKLTTARTCPSVKGSNKHYQDVSHLWTPVQITTMIPHQKLQKNKPNMYRYQAFELLYFEQTFKTLYHSCKSLIIIFHTLQYHFNFHFSTLQDHSNIQTYSHFQPPQYHQTTSYMNFSSGICQQLQ